MSNNLVNYSICSICLENIYNNEKIYNTICKHKFHKNCIKVWLETYNTCPNCRTFIINKNFKDYLDYQMEIRLTLLFIIYTLVIFLLIIFF